MKLKNVFIVAVAVMTSTTLYAADIPFQKIAGKYKVSACSGAAEGNLLNTIQEHGNGANPCDSFDEVVISSSGTMGAVTLHKSSEKVNSELKAVEGKSMDKINAVLAHSGLFVSFGADEHSVDVPGIKTSYVETENNFIFSSITDIGESKSSTNIWFQIDSSGNVLMGIKHSEQNSLGTVSKFNFAGTISK